VAGEERRVAVNLKMTPEQHELLKEAARADRRPLTSFILHTVLDHATVVLRRAAQEQRTQEALRQEARQRREGAQEGTD
jgi:uncharacterized protein (DUF1778 family)